MHVYVPTTLRGLRATLDAGVVGPAPVDAFAVTPGLREWFASGDDEELAYAAQTRAAAASLARLAADPDAVRRRVVLVLDVEDGVVEDTDGLETGACVVSVEVPVARLVSALVDDPSAEADVARELAAPDDPDAVSDAEDHQLLWFAVQELPDLLR